MEFVTEKGRPVILNRDHIVAVSPAYDQRESPILGVTALLTDLAPHNVPGAGPTIITVKGSYREVGAALGLIEAPEGETPDAA